MSIIYLYCHHIHLKYSPLLPSHSALPTTRKHAQVILLDHHSSDPLPAPALASFTDDEFGGLPMDDFMQLRAAFNQSDWSPDDSQRAMDRIRKTVYSAAAAAASTSARRGRFKSRGIASSSNAHHAQGERSCLELSLKARASGLVPCVCGFDVEGDLLNGFSSPFFLAPP